MGKSFHRTEATFLARVRMRSYPHERMREFQPHQVVAIRVGDPQSSRSEITRSLGQGVHRSQRRTGNFEQNLCESGKERRTATRAPPAEIFKAVANSSRSLPFSSRLRTKTGIAMGRRGHLRRCASAQYASNSPLWTEITLATAPWGPNKPCPEMSFWVTNPEELGDSSVIRDRVPYWPKSYSP